MTTARLTAGAMGDGVLPTDAKNLRELPVLLTMLPARATIAPRWPKIITLAVTIPDREPESLAAHVAEIAPHFERHCGELHRGGEPGRYCLHLPGKHLCVGGATRSAGCWGER